MTSAARATARAEARSPAVPIGFRLLRCRRAESEAGPSIPDGHPWPRLVVGFRPRMLRPGTILVNPEPEASHYGAMTKRPDVVDLQIFGRVGRVGEPDPTKGRRTASSRLDGLEAEDLR